MQKVRTRLLATAAFLAFASTAYGADMGMPMKAPPVAAPPPPTWTGFYIGGNLGAGFGDKWWNCKNVAGSDCEGGNANDTLGTTSMDGFLGGLQAGYNWQTGMWVLGIEGTWDWTDMHGQFPFVGFGGIRENSGSSKIDWIATIVGRVGVTIDRALVYVGGGAAWAREKDSVTDTCPSCSDRWTGSNTPFGATFLTGVEYAIDPRWSARIQYNFYDFESKDVTLTPNFNCSTCSLPISTQMRIHSITAGVNFRFNSW